MSSSSSDFTIRPAPEHQFLQELSSCSRSTTDEQIRLIAKKYINPLPLTSIEDSILGAVTVLMRDATTLLSEKEAYSEITGAIQAFNILLKYEMFVPKQQTLMSQLRSLADQQRKINDIFRLKEALKEHPHLQTKMLQDEIFLEMLGDFRSIYGREFKLENASLVGLALLWINPQKFPVAVTGMLMDEEATYVFMPGKDILKNFLQHARIARNASLKIVANRGFNFSESIEHIRARSSYYDLLNAIHVLPVKENLSLLRSIDEISDHRAMLSPIHQIHSESLRTAFIAQEVSDDRQEKYAAKLNKLLDSLKRADSDTFERKKIQEEIDSLKKLANYYPRNKGSGVIYQSAQWVPKLGLEVSVASNRGSLNPAQPAEEKFDPIQPIDRVAGFATQNGVKRETRTRLDFTKALGANLLDLNRTERSILGELLAVCDKITRETRVLAEDHSPSTSLTSIFENLDQCDSPWIKKLDATQKLTVAQTLDLFNHSACTHLIKLSNDQKIALAIEALRFAFDVNYKLTEAFLNLT